VEAETAIPPVRPPCASASQDACARHHTAAFPPALASIIVRTITIRGADLVGRRCAGAEAVLSSPRVFCAHRPPIWSRRCSGCRRGVPNLPEVRHC